MNALIVEDHHPTAQILIRALTSSGHEATTCHSAEEALDLLGEEGIDSFELFLLDLKLPGMDGISLCRWIRDHQGEAEPHVIVGTGSEHSEELANAFDAGADDYVEKPYSARILSLRFAVACEQVVARGERRRLNAQLNHEKDFVAAVFDTAAACIVALKPGGIIAKVNQATCDLTGDSESALEGVHFCEAIFDPDFDSTPIRKQLDALPNEDDATCRFESQFTGLDGEPLTITWTCRYVADHTDLPREDAPKPAIVCVGTDITERRKMEAQLAFLAERDPLTNLYNRSQLEPAVKAAIEATGSGSPAAVLYIDLDHFKSVNDAAGHAAGDELLQTVSTALSQCVRPDDTVIRLGGDEFVLILNHSSPTLARMVSARIRSAIDELNFKAAGHKFHVTVSIGGVLLDPGVSVVDAVAKADAACYVSKKNGRNTVTFAAETNGRCDEISHDTQWHDRIQAALASDGLDLWLQPIVSGQSGQPAFYEALLRLRHEGEWVSPVEFMSAARRFNLLTVIDRTVVRKALAILEVDPNLFISINLSGVSIADSRLPEFLVGELRRTRVNPSHLLFEITESDLISDLPNATDRLRQLEEHGIRFAIDDFGQGYSSFGYLRNLPVEMVKIDGSYIRNLKDDKHSAAFIRAITDLAHSIGLRCVAEHVEDATTFRILQSLGIDYAQGFLFGKPQPMAANQEPLPCEEPLALVLPR